MKTQKTVKPAKPSRRAGPTEEYTSFDRAFDYFNEELFGDQLTKILITFQRKGGARGYYSPKRFHHRTLESRTDEIALNPAAFEGRTDAEILSVLFHEMVHHWQYLFGKPGRGRYHNQEWADKMEALGLVPSHTEKPGGKRTGQRMSHFILSGGPFDVACTRLLAQGLRLNWQDPSREASRKPGVPSKVKFSCPGCGQNAWGKPELDVLCGPCTRSQGIPFEMESEEASDRRPGGPRPTRGRPGRNGTSRTCPPHLRASLDILGLETWPVEMEALKTAYRAMARRWHPDRNPGDAEAEAAFKEIQKAYEQVREGIEDRN
jgi:hypothetical protein